jgi:hypothetical protein
MPEPVEAAKPVYGTADELQAAGVNLNNSLKVNPTASGGHGQEWVIPEGDRPAWDNYRKDHPEPGK